MIYVTYFAESFENRETCIHHFMTLANTGIRIIVYAFSELNIELPNVTILAWSIEQTACYKLCGNLDLPDVRNLEKDTRDFLILQNSKTEFMADAIAKYDAEHYAWIDFNIAALLKNTAFLHDLRPIGKFLAIPGCVSKCTPDYNQIQWRFCGAFFVGDKESILDFHLKHNRLSEMPKLTWEVNFWVFLETEGLDVNWYKGDHNDTILYLSADFYAVKLPITTRQYHYINIPGYVPSSASYIYYKDQHILNTRYVNYWLQPDGAYIIPCGIIRNKNVVSLLSYASDSITFTPITFTPITFKEMEEPDLPDYLAIARYKSIGLEDIRLYEHNGALRFIATNINYSSSGMNRMVIGNYELGNYSECKVIESDYCEKNWVYVPVELVAKWMPEADMTSEYFIYSWSPITIIKIVGNKYETVLKIEGGDHRVKGSTSFVKYNGG